MGYDVSYRPGRVRRLQMRLVASSIESFAEYLRSASGLSAAHITPLDVM